MCNDSMALNPVLAPSDFERVQKIGHKTNTSTRPRPVVVRFRSEKTHDRMFESRLSLKQKNERITGLKVKGLKIFINENQS